VAHVDNPLDNGTIDSIPRETILARGRGDATTHTQSMR
jgi:hypothetical protein